MLAKCTALVGIPRKFKARDEVVAERNFGEFVNETDRATLDQALFVLQWYVPILR